MSLLDLGLFLQQAKIGKGKSLVFKIRHMLTQKVFAMKKVISTSSHASLLAFQEIVFLSRLDHPHILPILGYNRETKQSRLEKQYILTIVMPLMKETLSDNIRRNGGDRRDGKIVSTMMKQSIDVIIGYMITRPCYPARRKDWPTGTSRPTTS